MKFYVVNAITNKSYVKILGEYADRSTAQRVCTVSESNYDFSKRIIERCCYLGSVPDVEFEISEIDREPTVEEVALVMQDRLDPSKHRTLNTWKEIVEFIHVNTKKKLNTEEYISFYWVGLAIYDNVGKYPNSYLLNMPSLAIAYKKRIAELELDFKNGKIKILGNGEVIELV